MLSLPLRSIRRALFAGAAVAASAGAGAATLPTGFTEIADRHRPVEPDGHGVRARRPPVRLPAGRAAARHQERRAAADAVPDRDRSAPAASAACWASRSTRTSRPTTSSTSTTRPPRRRSTTASAASRRTATWRSRAARRSCWTSTTSAAPPTTTAAPCTSAPTASSTSRSARTRTARTRRRCRTCSARSCASTRTARSRPTIRSSATATGQQPRDLGARPAQPVHLRLPARHRPHVHQRRGAEHLRGDQRRHRRRELRLAGDRRADHEPGVPGAALLVRPRLGEHDRLRDHGRRVLQPDDRDSSRPTTRATTSSPTSAAAGSAASIPANGFAATAFATGIASPVDLRVATDGSLCYLARGTGSVWRVAYTAEQAPEITSHPVEPDRVGRAVGVVQRDRVRHAAAHVPVAARRRQHPGRHVRHLHARQRAAHGQRRHLPCRRQQRLRRRDQQQRDAHRDREQRAHRQHHRAGERHVLHGRRDHHLRRHRHRPGERQPAGSAFTWQVDFHHDTHIHPFIPATTGATGGSFVIPQTGQTETNVFYRIHLTVRDPQGLAHSTSVDLVPRVVDAHAGREPDRPAADARRPAGDDAVLDVRLSSAYAARSVRPRRRRRAGRRTCSSRGPTAAPRPTRSSRRRRARRTPRPTCAAAAPRPASASRATTTTT